MKLYWVETDDHAEDWFVVAASAEEAVDFHEVVEGYDVGDAWATCVCAVPAHAKTGWPSTTLLESLGATIIRAQTPRVVDLLGRKYCEGALEYEVRQVDDALFEARGQGRPNRTNPRTTH